MVVFLSSRVKLVFQQFALKQGYSSRNCGMTLSGRSYIMCRSILAAAASELSSVSWEQVKSKDMPCSDG